MSVAKALEVLLGMRVLIPRFQGQRVLLVQLALNLQSQARKALLSQARPDQVVVQVQWDQVVAQVQWAHHQQVLQDAWGRLVRQVQQDVRVQAVPLVQQVQ